MYSTIPSRRLDKRQTSGRSGRAKVNGERDRDSQITTGDQAPSEKEIQATADLILNAGTDTRKDKDEVQKTADLILRAGQGKA